MNLRTDARRELFSARRTAKKVSTKATNGDNLASETSLRRRNGLPYKPARHFAHRLLPGLLHLCHRCDRGLRQLGPRRILLLALGLLTIIAIIDDATGYAVSIYPFYALPVLLVVWYERVPLALCLAVISAIVWWIIDWHSGHTYPTEWLRVWEALVRFLAYSLVIFAAWTFRRQRNAMRARLALLERSRRLEAEIISISDREQQRIGRDLHDGVCQYLAAIALSASMLKRELGKLGSPYAERVGEVANAIRQVSNRTREIARGLSPVDRDEGGLESALEELAVTTSTLTGVACSFGAPGQALVPSGARDVHLFRIAQEAVSNALKHSRAQRIVIALENGKDGCSLRVSDNGTGFHPTLISEGGMGLRTMRYRAQMIGAQFEILSDASNGTSILCSIPTIPFEEPKPQK
ncbi:MAG: sensor histidine kinase [Verrucomicrobia bacterium]|nr:sensor histidine kinase [Verrucomicrobiota bacterium]